MSIVGADRLPDAGYLRAKVAQEQLVKAGPVPYTIVRSTQFFEFVPGIADAATIDHEVHATPGPLQPIASCIDELVRRLFATTADPRTVVTDPHAGYFGAELDANLLTPTPGAGAWIAPTSYDTWLHCVS